MSQQQREFRCTRNSPYRHQCAGQYDPKARQGHYIAALDQEDALAVMNKRFPDDLFGFTTDEVK